LFVSSEVYPLAKTGGLADVGASLPAALSAMGVEMRLAMPGYPGALAAAGPVTVQAAVDDFMGAGPLRILAARMPDTGLPVWLVDCPALFQRPGGLYQNEHGEDWPDNARRFAVFSHAVAQLALGRLVPSWRADIVHGNDWHTGLVPVVLAAHGGERPATIFTLHNLAYQGVFGAEVFPQLGLPGAMFSPAGIEYYGLVSFLKAGIRFSDRLTTVSPAYAREILTPEYGFGLDGLLRERAADFTGILNGVDYGLWDPAHDPHIPARFTARDIGGKRACKGGLQVELGLDVDPDAPLCVCVSRITDQKMADVLVELVPAIVERGAQFAILGDGVRALEERFREAARRFPGRAAARIGYVEPLAHRYQAGADILLHPARFEPCGLTQLYALRYGTLPVVRWTGGLSDTIVDATDEAIHAETASGFVFREASAAGFIDGIERALALFRQPLAWRKLQLRAMTQDFSWRRSAECYLALYLDLVERFDSIAERQATDPAAERAVDRAIRALKEADVDLDHVGVKHRVPAA
jgi:starch synthase